jgi:hypothetical protein
VRSWGGIAVATALIALVGAGSAVAAVPRGADPEIHVLSNRADLVSGGSALVHVDLPPDADPAAMRVDVDGRDVTGAFPRRPDGRHMGLVTGLRDGDNTLRVSLPGGRGGRLTLQNHPIGGPVLAGAQVQPWRCFDGALDAQCNRPPTYEFLYKPTGGGGLQPYDPEDPPADVAETTTDQGHKVPFIVRQEIGAIDRDEYRIAVLYDPEQPWAPWAPQPGWNHKLVITHGASCGLAYEQAEAPDVLMEVPLARGFAVMSHALDNSGHNCNMPLQAESLIMTKEHLVETYGELRYTIGSGCSGGALAQQWIANGYPGVYQGITPACSFPDSWSQGMLYEDYSLLRLYFENPSRWEPGVTWTADDQAAVWGHPNPVNPITFNTVIQPSRDPSRSCPGLEDAEVYHPETNPRGVRCALQDFTVAVFGKRSPESWIAPEKVAGGFAGRPWDNVGVEYGRNALFAGKISPQQFVDVNEKVGSRDIDYEWQGVRVAADRPALERVYRSGLVNDTRNLDKVAIIDLRGPDPGVFHDVYRSYAVRARLDREHGHHRNHVLWRGQVVLLGDPDFTDDSILAMDRWLAAVEKDGRDVPLARKIVEDRPEDVADRCTDGTPGGGDLPSEQCDAVVQSYTTARFEAGMPLTDDVIKCDLRPLRRSNYFPVQFSDAQWQRLERLFPHGVCDYTRPGTDRVPSVPWLSYAPGPGGTSLGAPPGSESLASLGLPSTRRCASRRRFTIRLRAPRGQRLRSARVQVNGRRVRVLRGRRLRARIDLRGLRGTVRVRIVARTRSGRRIVNERRYRTCVAKRPRRGR